MRKKVIVVALILLGLFFIQGAIGKEGELKVPFEEIKPSCYGKIDMSKEEFSLSEVGRECVIEEWLDKNVPGQNMLSGEETTSKGKDYRINMFPDSDNDAIKLSWDGYLSRSKENVITVEVYDESYIHKRRIEGEKRATITFLIFHRDLSGWGKAIKGLPKEKFEGPGGFVEKANLPLQKEGGKWVGKISIFLEKSVKSISIWKSQNTSQKGHYGFGMEYISETKSTQERNFEEVVDSLNTPKKLVEYMTENFDHWMLREDITSYEFKPYSPEEFFKVEVGTCENFAIFASHVLDQHGYNVELLYYRAKSSIKDETLPHTITIFRDKHDDNLYYITNVVDPGRETGFEIFGPFYDREKIIEREKMRLRSSQGRVEIFLKATLMSGSIGKKLAPKNFNEAVKMLNTPLKIGNYLARNFEFERRRRSIQNSFELFRSEKGNWYDFTVFISDLLDKNNYETEMLRLDFTVDGEKWKGPKPIGENDLIVIYRDKEGMLRCINQQAGVSTRISQPFSSLESLLEHQEKQRTLFPYTEGKIRIYRYAKLEPGTTDLKPDDWELRFRP